MIDNDKPAPITDFFEIVERERMHDGFLRLDRYQVRQRLFEGGLTPVLAREVVVAHEAVGVLCYDPDRDEIVLIQQARLAAGVAGFDTLQTEIVAGIKEAGETPASVARREVTEETGLTLIGEPEFIVHMISTPGHSTENVHLFCGRVDATRATGVHGLAAEHEDIRVIVMPFADFAARLHAGKISNAYTIVAAYWLLLNRERLRAGWAR